MIFEFDNLLIVFIVICSEMVHAVPKCEKESFQTDANLQDDITKSIDKEVSAGNDWYYEELINEKSSHER